MKPVQTVLALVGMAVAAVAALPLILLALPFWAVAGLTEGLHRLLRATRPDVSAWGELIEFEPVVGWKPKANMETHAEALGVEGRYSLTTDSEGWRGSNGLDDSDVVVFGDSFAFGFAADDGQFFADEASDVLVKSVGANGYNMVQGLLWMERYSERLAGKLVVWLVYYGNDLYDNLQPHMGRYRAPFVRAARENGAPGRVANEEWELVTDHVSPEPWPFVTSPGYTRQLAEICTPGILSDRVFGACRYLIGRADDLCRSTGARLAVMGNPDVDMMRDGFTRLAKDPHRCDPELVDARLGRICSEIGIPFVALSRHLSVEDHLEDDCHWAPAGHRKVAWLLEELHREVLGGLAESREDATAPAAVPPEARVAGTGR